MPEKPRNVGASVRQRLLNLARASGQPLDVLLTRYALERLLHRLSISAHRDRFVLKGALLLTTWFDEPHRATRDLDLLGFGDPSEDALLTVFREVMSITVDDGVSFDTAKLQVRPIREELEYGGSRVRTTAALAGVRIPAVVDIGFGDAIEPGANDIDLPVLLEMPSPDLRGCPQETVHLEDMLEFCGDVLAYTTGHDGESLRRDAMRLDATLRKTPLIGEAATRIPEANRARAPDIP